MILDRAKHFLSGFLGGCLLQLLVFLLEKTAGISPVIAGKKNALYLFSLALTMVCIRMALSRIPFDSIKGMAFSLFLSALLIFTFRFPG